MGAFSGTLRTNEVFSAIYNMIISQTVFADNFGKHQTLVDKARVDGGMYGDSKLYYAVQALKSVAWTKDSAAANLLTVSRPAAPSCQVISINQFRQIEVSVDEYLSKRAFADANSFANFNSVILGMIGETKKIYDGSLYNAFIGTNVSSTGKQSLTWTLSGSNDGQTIAKNMADLLVDMSDYTKLYNDYGYLRSYDPNDVKVIWNAKFYNEIKKVDLPTIFHKDGLVDKLESDVLPEKYFGTIITSSNKDDYADNTPTTGKPLDKDGTYAYTPGSNNANGCVRTLVEQEVTVSGTAYHLFPGEELPVGCKLATTATTGTLAFGTVYIVDAKIMAKVVVKLPPYMSSFEVGNSFYNPKALLETHYLTFSHNSLEHLKNYPFITIKRN